MAKVVLNNEVGVAGGRQGCHGQKLVQSVGFVAELMGGIDPDAIDSANRQREPYLVIQRCVFAAGNPGTHEGHGVLGRNKCFHNPVVVLVLLQCLHRRFRRIALILADSPIQGRDDAVYQRRASPCQGFQFFWSQRIAGQCGQSDSWQCGTE